MALVNSYAWRSCDGSDSIFVDTNFSAPSDYVYYKEQCYFNTYVVIQVENAINPLNGNFFNSCVECHNSTSFVSIPCSLYGQIDIYLSGNIELVLEGQLEGPQLKGQIDIELQGMVDIYLQGLMNDPLLNGELELTLNLEGCFDGEQLITYSVHRTTNCCGGDTHYVSIPSTYQVGDSFIGSDGVCYQIGSLATGTEPTIDAAYLFEGGCEVCTQQKPCLTPTPTITTSVTPSVTQTPSNTVTPSITQTPSNTVTPTPSVTPTNVIPCNPSEGTYLAGWIKESYNGTPNSGRFQTRLIQVLPPDLPDPDNINAPVNYDQIRVSRYEQGGVDFNSTFTSLNGSTSGVITLEYVNGDLISYYIENITYVAFSYLLIDLGNLISTELESYVNSATYGICISSISITPTPTPSNTVTPSLTPTLTPSTSVLLNRYFATRCIESGTVVIEVPEGASVLETYSADDGNCYQLLNTTTDPSTVNAIELKENGCADCISPTPTPTPTPTPSGICPSCSTYGITNFDRHLTLQITYTDCDSGSSVGVTILSNSGIILCSCDDPIRTGGTLDWGFINNGSC